MFATVLGKQKKSTKLATGLTMAFSPFLHANENSNVPSTSAILLFALVVAPVGAESLERGIRSHLESVLSLHVGNLLVPLSS